MSLDDRILIAGGGIGGLTLAIALARHGLASHVLEARSEFPSEGAGIQLGPNATRILADLGVAERLETSVASPESIAVLDGEKGTALTRLPLGSWMADRHGQPYWVALRRDLQGALLETARSEPAIELSTSRRVAEVLSAADSVSVQLEDDTTLQGSMLVGADGLWSAVRRHVQPALSPRYAGSVAARAVIDRTGLASPFSDMSTGVWLAPSAHVVHYPVEGGRSVAVVAIARGPEPEAGWASPVSAAEIAQRFAKVAPELLRFLRRPETWRQWPLFRAVPQQSWSKGRTVLLGDAAHPILPYLAQGGAMAIEDALVLADAIASHRGDPALAIRRYESERQPRTRQIAAASQSNGEAYHMSGLQAFGRNAVLRSTPGSVLMRRYDWIYGWRHMPTMHEVEL